jgi:hypothetical protein
MSTQPLGTAQEEREMAERLQEQLQGETSEKWTWRKRCCAAERALDDRRADQRFTAASRVLAELAPDGNPVAEDVAEAIRRADALMLALYQPVRTNPLEARKQ